MIVLISTMFSSLRADDGRQLFFFQRIISFQKFYESLINCLAGHCCLSIYFLKHFVSLVAVLPNLKQTIMFALCSNYVICEKPQDGTYTTSQKATLQHIGVAQICASRSFCKCTISPHNFNTLAPPSDNTLILTDQLTELFNHLSYIYRQIAYLVR